MDVERELEIEVGSDADDDDDDDGVDEVGNAIDGSIAEFDNRVGGADVVDEVVNGVDRVDTGLGDGDDGVANSIGAFDT